MADIRFPHFAKNRGPGYWLRPSNLLAARRKVFRPDESNEWRYMFGEPEPPARSMPFSRLLDAGRPVSEPFCFIILGDTGEGDQSQYGLVPLIRVLRPDFLIINGDVAYPAGRISAVDEDDDYVCGFFQPYQGLNRPAWAVPGNHEYYAKERGKGFYDTFCSRAFASRWSAHGLRLVPQPGFYWELSEPNLEEDLVVIGLDTGQEARLDRSGKKWWQIWKSGMAEDTTQLRWLADRLSLAESKGHRVIVLFHIPGLVSGKHKDGTGLRRVHQLIAAHRCVKLVIAADEHNYQQYTPEQFDHYLEKLHGATPAGHVRYLVSGGGGAYLMSTRFKGDFSCDCRYPTPAQWESLARLGRKAIEVLGLSKNLLARVAGMVEDAARADADVARYLSMVLVTVERARGPARITVTPVFLDGIEHLYRHLPREAIVDVSDKRPDLDAKAVAECRQDGQQSSTNLSFEL